MGKALPVVRRHDNEDTAATFRRQGEKARHLRAQLAASFVASEAVIREMRAIRAGLSGAVESAADRVALPGKSDLQQLTAGTDPAPDTAKPEQKD